MVMKNERNWAGIIISLEICALASGCGMSPLLNFHNSVVSIGSVWVYGHNQNIELQGALTERQEQFDARYNLATSLAEEQAAVDAHLANILSFTYSRSPDYDADFVNYVDSVKDFQAALQNEDKAAIEGVIQRQFLFGTKLTSMVTQSHISAVDTAQVVLFVVLDKHELQRPGWNNSCHLSIR